MAGRDATMKLLVLGQDNTVIEGYKSLEIHVFEKIAAMGHDVHIITGIPPYFEPNEAIPKRLTFNYLDLNLERTEKEREEFINNSGILNIPFGHPDIIFLTSLSGIKLGLDLKRVLNAPLFVQVLDIPVFRIKLYKNFRENTLDRLRLLHSVDGIIFNSHGCTNLFKEMAPDCLVPTKMIYYGVDTKPKPQLENLSKEYDLVTCHRLVSHKCTELLLFAMSILKKRGYDLNLILIGIGDELRHMIDLAYFLRVKVRFALSVSDADKWELLHKSKLYVSPDLGEYIGCLAPLEAMHCGVPAICSDLEINKERFLGNAIYFAAGDPVACADAIEQEITKPTQIDFAAIKTWIKKERSHESQAVLTLNFIEEVLNAQHHKAKTL
jgi:glycosyltransferase involved in cell wall biosynthesis